MERGKKRTVLVISTEDTECSFLSDSNSSWQVHPLPFPSHPKEGAYISNFTLVWIDVIMLYSLELSALLSPYAIYGFEFKEILGNGWEKH